MKKRQIWGNLMKEERDLGNFLEGKITLRKLNEKKKRLQECMEGSLGRVMDTGIKERCKDGMNEGVICLRYGEEVLVKDEEGKTVSVCVEDSLSVELRERGEKGKVGQRYKTYTFDKACRRAWGDFQG